MLSCGDKERMGKKTPNAAAPARAGPLAHPRPAGRVETRPWRARHRRAFPAGRGLRSACSLGRVVPAPASPLPAGCRAVSPVRARHPARFVAPRRGQGFGTVLLLAFWGGACLRFGDWPGLAFGGVDQLSCGDKKGALVNKSTVRLARSAGGARDAIMSIPLAALRPHPICRRSRRFLPSVGAKETPLPQRRSSPVTLRRRPRPTGRVETRPAGNQTSTRQFPPAAAALGAAEGRPLPARLGHCRRVVVPSFMARHSHTIRRPGPGGLQDSGSCCSVCEGAAAAGYWPGQALTAHRSEKVRKLVLVF